MNTSISEVLIILSACFMDWLFEIGAGVCDMLAGCLIDLQWETYIEAARWKEWQSCTAFKGFHYTLVICESIIFFFWYLLMPFWFIQFLGRDKDDGVRRSAVSGKKVWFLNLFIMANP